MGDIGLEREVSISAHGNIANFTKELGTLQFSYGHVVVPPFSPVRMLPFRRKLRVCTIIHHSSYHANDLVFVGTCKVPLSLPSPLSPAIAAAPPYEGNLWQCHRMVYFWPHDRRYCHRAGSQHWWCRQHHFSSAPSPSSSPASWRTQPLYPDERNGLVHATIIIPKEARGEYNHNGKMELLNFDDIVILWW